MIYLDNAATTKPSLTALDNAKYINEDLFYNPSALYMGGLNVKKIIVNAKETILKCLGLSNSLYEVIFTSCGSESDNTAIFCAKKHGLFITDKGEHSAVYNSFLELKNRNIKTELIDLNSDGTVNTEKLYDFIKNNKVDFVSIVHVNNETGGINDINAIAKKIKELDKDIVFHSDGVQAFGKLPYKLSNDIDLYSISAHKINGLKGVGALIKKRKQNLFPLIYGGGQENTFRSGTENVFGIKVFENATIEHYLNIDEDYNRVKELKQYFIDNLNKNVFKIISSENGSPYVLSVSAVGLRGEVIMHSLENYNIIVGNGSACSSKNRYSRILTACGYKNDVLDGVIRISFSNQTTMEDCVFACEKINEIGIRLKGIM